MTVKMIQEFRKRMDAQCEKFQEVFSRVRNIKTDQIRVDEFKHKLWNQNNRSLPKEACQCALTFPFPKT